MKKMRRFWWGEPLSLAIHILILRISWVLVLPDVITSITLKQNIGAVWWHLSLLSCSLPSRINWLLFWLRGVSWLLLGKRLLSHQDSTDNLSVLGEDISQLLPLFSILNLAHVNLHSPI